MQTSYLYRTLTGLGSSASLPLYAELVQSLGFSSDFLTLPPRPTLAASAPGTLQCHGVVDKSKKNFPSEHTARARKQHTLIGSQTGPGQEPLETMWTSRSLLPESMLRVAVSSPSEVSVWMHQLSSLSFCLSQGRCVWRSARVTSNILQGKCRDRNSFSPNHSSHTKCDDS